MHNHHSDEYQMRANDLTELEHEYNKDTKEGQARIEQYDTLKAKTFKLFDERLGEFFRDGP